MKREILQCNRGDYRTGIIDDPYGLPHQLVDKCIEWHEKAHPSHTVRKKVVG